MSSRSCSLDHDHPHGHWSCYSLGGCRCDDCRAWRSREYRSTSDFYKAQRALAGRDVYVSAAGSVRRLQALACLGWSARHVAERTGVTEHHLSRVRRGGAGGQVRASVAAAIREAYEQLSMTVRDSRDGRKVTAVARRHGWRPPLDWDEEALDAA